MKAMYMLILLLGLNFASKGQSLSTNGLAPQKYFDFWVGTWELTWEDANGSTAEGVNKIEKILNDKVIKENFEGLTGQNKGYIGKSWSVYNPSTKEWKQTWVDNSGGYLEFTGAIDGDKRIFRREAINQQGNKVLQRMVFYDIKVDSFTWDWESSLDDGESWTLQWRILYKRKETKNEKSAYLQASIFDRIEAYFNKR